MYQRLKNLLGVSLIILAIVLSQIPMGAVQADTSAEEQTTENVTQETEETAESEGTSEEASADSSNTVSEDIQSQEENILLMTADDGVNAAADGTASTPAAQADEYEISFDYGFTGLSPTILSLKILQGNLIPNDTKWEITAGNGAEELIENMLYTISGVSYKFTGWYKDIGCKDKWELDSNTVQEAMTLYAGWSCQAGNKVIEIKYSADDADNNKLQTIYVPAGERLGTQKPVTPNKTGSQFLRWADGTTDNDINWNIIPTDKMTFIARWSNMEYKVNFDANGGAFTDGSTSKTEKVLNGAKIDTAQYPAINPDSLTGCTVETDTWYTDKDCLQKYDTETLVTKEITLYKKWLQKTDEGYTMNPGGTVLYLFDGEQEEVEIPASVRTIAAGAFPDMKNIEKIILPAGIVNIIGDAFPGANNITRTIYIYSSSDGSNDSMIEGKELADRYDHFEYKSSGGSGDGSADSIILEDVICNLNKVNIGIDDNPYFTYPKVTLPQNLTNGKYTVVFTELNEPQAIKGMLQNAGYKLDSEYVYYMDISMTKSGEQPGYKPSWGKPSELKVTMPLPFSWYGRDTGKIKLFTVNEAGTALEEISLHDFEHNIFSYSLEHLSEFALVYTGTIDSGSSDGGNNGGSSGGGDGGNNGGSSGGSNGGGGSSSDSSATSGNGSNSSTSNENGQGSITPIVPVVTTPDPSLPQVVTPSEPVTSAPGYGTGTGNGQTSHVKDSTPKTGDPLEYRSILVCSFFSIGVLLLLIGNKKKASSSSPYLRA